MSLAKSYYYYAEAPIGKPKEVTIHRTPIITACRLLTREAQLDAWIRYLEVFGYANKQQLKKYHKQLSDTREELEYIDRNDFHYAYTSKGLVVTKK